MLRAALDRRAGIQEHRRGVSGGNDGRQRRPIDAGQPAERRMRSHDRRAGVPGAEERIGAATAHGVGGDANRGTRLAPQRRRRRFRHLDPFGRVEQLDVERTDTRMPEQLALDFLTIADEQQSDLQMARRTVININVPALAPEAVKGIRVVRQRKPNLGMVQSGWWMFSAYVKCRS